ncbi:Integrase [Lysobacter enzymogenes]|nr:Integrase [Lysobacter enzymogenes]
MGIGPVAAVSLQDARQRAYEARRLVADGKDPIELRIQARASTGATWGQSCEALIASLKPSWKTPAQAQQWEQSLADYGPGSETPIKSIDTAAALACLRPLWSNKTETATRLRGRCERVWDFARVSGLVAGDNPFRWKGHLDKLLAKPSKVAKKRNFPAMPYPDLPAFMRLLRAEAGAGRRALEFTILTAARTAEVTSATWAEFDLASKVWNRPAQHMKAGRAHSIPLSDAAIAILAALPRTKPPFPLSENTMLFLLQRTPPRGLGQPYTVHGMRSTFSDWAYETTSFPRHVIEMALAHTIKEKAEAAYRRGALLDKRRELMEAWAAHCAG